MPSETMDSSSFFSKEGSFRDERQLGFWNSEGINNFHGAKADLASSPYISSPYGLRRNSLIANGFEHSDSDLNRHQRINALLGTYTPRLEGASSFSMLRGLSHSLGSASFFTEEDDVILSRAMYENAPLSSSFPELYSPNLRYPTNNISYFPSVGADDRHEEKESLESLKELEAKTIGNLLPDDDDDLFYGVADQTDSKNRLISRDGIIEDFFTIVGELEIGEDGQKKSKAFEGNLNSPLGRSNSTTDLNHPLCEYPSRTLFVRNINSSIQDSEVQALFGQYGDISLLYTTCKRRGFVMISYYDIRAACNAMKALQDKPMQHRKLDIHFSLPKENPSEKDVNQGTLVVSDLDSSVSNDELRRIFGGYGEVKEIREIPHRSRCKFIEFYDIRAADAALKALNRSDIAEKKIKLEPSHPGGARWSMHPFSSEMDQENSGLHLRKSSYPNVPPGFSGSIPFGGITSNSDTGTVLSSRSSGRPPMSPYREIAFQNGPPSLLNSESVKNQFNSMEGSKTNSQLKYEIWGTPSFHSRSLPAPPSNMTVGRDARVSPRGHPVEWNETGYSASANGNCLSPVQHHMWSRSPRSQPQGMTWPNSPSFINGTCSPHPQQMHGIGRPPPQLANGLTQMNNHPMGSAPSGHPSLWERRRGYGAESPDTSAFNTGSLDGLRIPGDLPHVMELIPHNVFPCNGGSPMESVHSQNVQLNPQNQRFLIVPTRGQLSPLLSPLLSPFQSPTERTRGRRRDGSLNQGDKKQFELDIDRIMNGEDKRTTLMIKNIPNKYTSKMLLATIDEQHNGTYDFLYLPIDFKNKCNVGYSFINMIEPSKIVPLYQALNGKKWERFNSEKVASITYARIQGKAALIAHFQNSSLMNEDRRCRPILFHSDGPNAGIQVPFPVGANIRSRPRIPSSSSLESIQDGLQDSANEDEFSCGNSSSEASVC